MKEAEVELQKSKLELERRVQERTQELAEANEALREQVIPLHLRYLELAAIG